MHALRPPRAVVEADAKARSSRTKGAAAAPDLSDLAVAEAAHAARMLAMFAPPMTIGSAGVKDAWKPPPAVGGELAAEEQQAWAPAAPARAAAERPCPEASDDLGDSEELCAARAEEAAARAAAEAAVEREIERGRSSTWWKRLEDHRPAPPVERCGALALNTGSVAGRVNSSNPLRLPVQEFAVCVARVTIRAEASPEAPVLGAKRSGDRVRACEESFDGWVKLADEPGWIVRASGSFAAAAVPAPLAPVAGASALDRLLAAPLLSRAPGRQMFEVVAESGVRVFREPSEVCLPCLALLVAVCNTSTAGKT